MSGFILEIEVKMDDNQVILSSLPPFLAKTYEMVDDPASNSIVSWSHTNKSFIVWNHLDLSRVLLPRFFKHNNFSSFIRQLNTYGFKKVDPEQWEFANDNFTRDQPQLMKKICRRKPVHSHSMQNHETKETSSVHLTKSERKGYQDHIERLKHDESSLKLQLHLLQEEKQVGNDQTRSLRTRLQNMENRQQKMVSFLAQLIKEPGLETNSRKRRLLITNSLQDELISSQTAISENPDANFVLPLNMDPYKQLESSLGYWEHVLYEVERSVEDIHIPKQPSCSKDNNNSPIQLDESAENSVETTSTMQIGDNDVFWAQFLTENPGSTNTNEVQFERKESDDDMNGSKTGDQCKYWWNMGNVNNLTETT